MRFSLKDQQTSKNINKSFFPNNPLLIKYYPHAFPDCDLKLKKFL